MWPLILQSLLATSMVRQPLHQAASQYLTGPPHPRLDPFVLPAIQGYLNLDKAVMGPIDAAQNYAQTAALARRKRKAAR